jgi:glycosyltransferase involved in cell wall biosynthesis
MKTVVLFIPHLGVGGAELQLCLLAPRLRAAGWEPTVATLEDLHGIAPRLSASGVEVVFLPRAGRSGADAIVALARFARRRRADVIHAWLWASNWRAALARLLAPQVRVVASIRSTEDDLSPWHLIAYRALAPSFGAIIVNSRAVLERSAGRTGIPRDIYRVVNNGVELDRLDRESREGAALPWDPEPSPIVGYVGTLSARKRAASLAPLAARILERVPRARCLVVGDGPERAALEAACAALGIAGRFEFAGYADRVGPYLRRMNVLIHPSMNEGSSNAILEAMAARVPVVAYAVSGNRETVVHGVTGTLVPDGREDALAEAAADLLDDPDEARRRGDAGRARIEHNFSVDAMVRATTAIYEEVTSAR